MKNKLTALTIITLASLIYSVSSYGWGQKGHDTTAFIAESHLTPATLNAINDLLDGKSIIYYANWLDNASHTPQYEYTKTWHYKNIDDGIAFEEAPLLETGDIITATYKQINILTSNDATKEEKQLALKILVHILGDMHQPMHMGHASDLGGNRWTVKYFGRDSNLHSTWDSSLPESSHKWTYTEWQNQIDRTTPEEYLEIVKEGTPEKWSEETFEICKKVYESTPENTNISYDYIADWTPVIEQQFLKGGIRLADLLNSIFDKEYTQYNLVVNK